jgi:hypothetical protein
LEKRVQKWLGTVGNEVWCRQAEKRPMEAELLAPVPLVTWGKVFRGPRGQIAVNDFHLLRVTKKSE